MRRARQTEVSEMARLAHRIEVADAWIDLAIRAAREVRVEPGFEQDLADALVLACEAQLTLQGR